MPRRHRARMTLNRTGDVESHQSLLDHSLDSPLSALNEFFTTSMNPFPSFSADSPPRLPRRDFQDFPRQPRRPSHVSPEFMRVMRLVQRRFNPLMTRQEFMDLTFQYQLVHNGTHPLYNIEEADYVPEFLYRHELGLEPDLDQAVFPESLFLFHGDDPIVFEQHPEDEPFYEHPQRYGAIEDMRRRSSQLRTLLDLRPDIEPENIIRRVLHVSSTARPFECPVCITQHHPGVSIVHLQCSHRFCVACITSWLIKNTKCPMCRQSIQLDPNRLFVGQLRAFDQ